MLFDNNDLQGLQADGSSNPQMIELIGKILASAAKRIQGQDPAALKTMEGKNPKSSKLDIILKK